MTLTHSRIFSSPPPLLTCSRAHLFTCAVIAIISSYHDTLMRCWYLDVETYTLTSSYFESRYLDVKTLIISSYRDALICLFIRGGDIHSRQHHGIIHSNMIIQHPWSIDKHLPDSLNIRCSARCLRQQAVEQYMAMVWADGQEGFKELRIEWLNAGWFGGMALDVVFWGVASLNKVSIVENMGGMWRIRGKVRAED